MENREEIMDIMRARHAVRSYQETPIEEAVVVRLQEEMEFCNKESGLHIQLVTQEPHAFGSFLTHYGLFSGVRNYMALVGTDDAVMQEKAGYYGQRLVLDTQRLGLNSCWVAGTFSRKKTPVVILPGEALFCVIPVGYGKTAGKPHRSRKNTDVSNLDETSPSWFKDGVEAALLAPTALNRQKFFLSRQDTVVAIQAAGPVDRGIVKYQFELGAGRENFTWAT